MSKSVAVHEPLRNTPLADQLAGFRPAIIAAEVDDTAESDAGGLSPDTEAAFAIFGADASDQPVANAQPAGGAANASQGEATIAAQTASGDAEPPVSETNATPPAEAATPPAPAPKAQAPKGPKHERRGPMHTKSREHVAAAVAEAASPPAKVELAADTPRAVVPLGVFLELSTVNLADLVRGYRQAGQRPVVTLEINVVDGYESVDFVLAVLRGQGGAPRIQMTAHSGEGMPVALFTKKGYNTIFRDELFGEVEATEQRYLQTELLKLFLRKVLLIREAQGLA